MKQYYCPYCGERTFNSLNKFSQKRAISVGSKTANRMWFTCSNCHNEVDKKATAVSNKHYNFIIPLYLILAVAFLVFAVIKLYLYMILCMIGVAALSLIMSFVGYKYDVFVRKEGTYDDVYIKANIAFTDKKYCVDDMIYLIKPTSEYSNKVMLNREYIVAVDGYDEETQTCNLRIIKPKQIKTDVTFDFDVYYEDAVIGTGKCIK